MILGKTLNLDVSITRVLIADQDEMEVARLSNYVSDAFPGCQTVSAPSLQKIIRIIHDQMPDFIIADLNLSDSSGLDTLKKVIAQAPDIPVLIYASTEDMALSLEALKLGAQDYLIKGRGNAQTLHRIMRYSMERKRIEQQLSLSEQMMRTFFLHVPAGIVVLDDTFRIVMTSHRWREDNGLVNEMLEGRRLDEILLNAGKSWYRHYQTCMEGEHIRCPEEEFITNNNQTAYVRWEMMPWFDAWGRIGGVIAFTEFITEQRQLRKELEDANQHLEERVATRTRDLVAAVIAAENAQASKDQFFASITHEFRTPLHAIINFSRFGIDKHASADKGMLHEFFKDIHASGLRLQALVDDVLDLTKHKAGMATMEMGRFNLSSIIQNAQRELSPLLSERQLTFEKKVIPDYDSVLCDSRRIHQVLTNLISNAAKFSHKGGAIVVRLSDTNAHKKVDSIKNMVLISVSDGGIGIPDTDLESIFDPFVQSQRLQSGLYATGTGLGLAICRQIIQAHGGVIWAENNPDAGATIYFTLPSTQRIMKR